MTDAIERLTVDLAILRLAARQLLDAAERAEHVARYAPPGAPEHSIAIGCYGAALCALRNAIGVPS